MTMTFAIPTPVALLAVAAFVLVLSVHVWHAVVMVGRHRLWHLIHTLMAAAMVAMYSPAAAVQVPPVAGAVVFGVVALLVTGTLALGLLRGHRIGVLWLLSLTDLAWMTAMFSLMVVHLPGVGVAGAVWFAGQALGWASGRFGAVLERRGLGEAVSPTHPSPIHSSGVGRVPGPGALVPADRQRARTGGGPIDGGRHDLTVRVGLTVMSAGMAYMFLALAASADEMASMAGM